MQICVCISIYMYVCIWKSYRKCVDAFYIKTPRDHGIKIFFPDCSLSTLSIGLRGEPGCSSLSFWSAPRSKLFIRENIDHVMKTSIFSLSHRVDITKRGNISLGFYKTRPTSWKGSLAYITSANLIHPTPATAATPRLGVVPRGYQELTEEIIQALRRLCPQTPTS